MNDDPITKCKLCLLCMDSSEWPYPKNGHHLETRHFTKGKTWEPLKEHKDYELHLRMVDLLNLNKK